MDEPWAQLVCTTDMDSDPIPIYKERFVLGRATDCDYSFSGNMLISSKHCTIERDAVSNTVCLHDSSTNGTLVNKKQKVKKQKVAINHGDEIHLIFRNDDSSQDVAFMYQDMAELKKEMNSDTSDEQINEVLLNQTLAYETRGNEAEIDDEKLKNKPKPSKPAMKRLQGDDVGRPCSIRINSSRKSHIACRKLSHAAEKEVRKLCQSQESKRAVRREKESVNTSSSDENNDNKKAKVNEEVLTTSFVDETQPIFEPEPIVEPCDPSTVQTLEIGSVCDPSSVQTLEICDTDIADVDPKKVQPSKSIEKKVETFTGRKLRSSTKSAEKSAEVEIRKDDKESKTATKSRDDAVKDDKGKNQELESLDNKIAGPSNLKDTECKEKKDAEESTTKSDEDKVDAIEETLLCIICQEILYKCISVQPCMHTFCSSCYSDWMAVSKECPSCRTKVDRISKNYIVNNLVEAYLAAHPEKRRPDDELKELDAKNKITKDMLELPKHRRIRRDDNDNDYDEDDEDEDDDDYEGSDASDNDDYNAYNPYNPYNPIQNNVQWGLMGYAGPAYNYPIRPPPTICRECPGYAGINNVAGVAAAATATAATADAGAATAANAADNFVCAVNQIHVLCQCCHQAMPQRPRGTTTRPQRCDICMGNFCHAYWGCRRVGCAGCLGKFHEIKFGREAMNNLILDNQYESDILINYLDDQGISVEDFVKECINRLEAGRYTCAHQLIVLDRRTNVCFICARKNLAELALQYRRELTNFNLPAAVATRPDCYWGSNCRTQKNKPAHAIKFNHICEQTRRN